MGFPAISLLARFCSLPAGKIFPAGQSGLATQVTDLKVVIGNESSQIPNFSLSFPVRQGKSGSSAACW